MVWHAMPRIVQSAISLPGLTIVGESGVDTAEVAAIKLVEAAEKVDVDTSVASVEVVDVV
jgi:hypothetical protein